MSNGNTAAIQRALLTHTKQQLTLIHRALRALNEQHSALCAEERRLQKLEHEQEIALARSEERIKVLAEPKPPDELDRLARHFINSDSLDEAIEVLERKLGGA